MFSLQAELKGKWEMEKSILDESRKEAEKNYDELNEQVSVALETFLLFFCFLPKPLFISCCSCFPVCIIL